VPIRWTDYRLIAALLLAMVLVCAAQAYADRIDPGFRD